MSTSFNAEIVWGFNVPKEKHLNLLISEFIITNYGNEQLQKRYQHILDEATKRSNTEGNIYPYTHYIPQIYKEINPNDPNYYNHEFYYDYDLDHIIYNSTLNKILDVTISGWLDYEYHNILCLNDVYIHTSNPLFNELPKLPEAEKQALTRIAEHFNLECSWILNKSVV